MTSVSIRNFGCRVNQAEAFDWAEAFRSRGLALETDEGRSDVILINSCTLTGRADRDVKRFIHKAARGNPRAKIVVTGCLAERAADEIRDWPGVRMVIPNRMKESLVEQIASLAASPADAASAPLPFFRARAFVKIQDGCDFRCAYCIIPSVRGRSVSRPLDAILGRIKQLTERGYQEIVLAGIHLCSYGSDLKPAGSLAELLETIERAEGRFRIRLSSLDPRFLSGRLVERLAGKGRVAPHFHLSLQSGSETVLRAMGRNSSPGSYREAVERLKAAVPDAAVGADIIAGFPAETDEEFRKTFDFLAGTPLDYFHVFPFSAREGTSAARMEPVDEKRKSERAAILRDLSREKQTAFRRRFIGREFDAVVITKKGRGAELLTGNFITVAVPDCPAERTQRIRVRITDVDRLRTGGRVVPDEEAS